MPTKVWKVGIQRIDWDFGPDYAWIFDMTLVFDSVISRLKKEI